MMGLDTFLTLSPVLKVLTNLLKISLYEHDSASREGDTKSSIVAETRELSGKRIRALPRECSRTEFEMGSSQASSLSRPGYPRFKNYTTHTRFREHTARQWQRPTRSREVTNSLTAPR